MSYTFLVRINLKNSKSRMVSDENDETDYTLLLTSPKFEDKNSTVVALQNGEKGIPGNSVKKVS